MQAYILREARNKATEGKSNEPAMSRKSRFTVLNKKKHAKATALGFVIRPKGHTDTVKSRTMFNLLPGKKRMDRLLPRRLKKSQRVLNRKVGNFIGPKASKLKKIANMDDRREAARKLETPALFAGIMKSKKKPVIRDLHTHEPMD